MNVNAHRHPRQQTRLCRVAACTLAVLFAALPAVAATAKSLGGPAIGHTDKAGRRQLDIAVLEQDRRHTRIRILVNAYTLERGVIAVAGMVPLEVAGAPDLPQLFRTVHVPDGAVVGHRIVSREERLLPGVDITPSRGPRRYGEPPDLDPVEKGDVYDEDRDFPDTVFELLSPLIIRDVRAVKFRVSPFRYNPVRRELMVTTELVFDLLYVDPPLALPSKEGIPTEAHAHAVQFPSTQGTHFSVPRTQFRSPPGRGQGWVPKRGNRRRSRAFEALYPRLLLNYSPQFHAEVDSPTEDSETPAQAVQAPAGDGILATAGGAPQPPPTENMLTITTPEYALGLADFIQWKESRGIDVELNTSSASNGVDAVRSVIQTKYDNEGLTYILLVGDSADVPSPQQSILEGRSSDPSYALLEGDDFYGDALISRISVSSVAELENQLNKLLVHEQALFDSNGWIFHAMVAALSEFGGTAHANTIESAMLAHPDHFTNVVKLLEDEGAGSADIKNAIENTGINIFTYMGHGNANGLYSIPFSVADAQNLRDSNGRFPLIHTIGCSVGEFDRAGSDCFAEAMMNAGSVAEPAGAAAILASVENMKVGVGEPAQLHAFTDLYYRPGEQTVGALCFEATVVAMNQQDNDGAETLYRQWHLFGDCSMPIWQRSPVRLRVELPASATEGDGLLVQQGTVTLDTAPSNSLAVSLQSSDETELRHTNTVTVAAGNTNVSFDLEVMDDTDLDGSRVVTVSAWSPDVDLGTAEAAMTIHDDESAVLSLEILPASAAEGDGILTSQGVVTVSAAPDADVTVSVSSDDPGEASVAGSVVIPNGETGSTFDLTIVDDTAIDGPQTVTLTAHVENWTDGADAISVLDNEGANLIVTLPAWAGEGDGVLTNAGGLAIAGTLETNLVVQLFSADPTEALVPSNVIIGAGETSALFNVSLVDDPDYDGLQAVTVTAAAPGFAAGQDTMDVADDEVHHLAFATVPSPQTSGIPFTVVITAFDTNGAVAALVGTADLAASCPTGAIPIHPTAADAFSEGQWAGEVLLRTAITNVHLTADDGGGHVTQSNPFDVAPYLPPAPFGPQPPHEAEDVARTVDLSWNDPRYGTILNGGFETGDFTGWIVESSGGQGFLINDGTCNPSGPDTALPPYEGEYAALTAPFTEGLFTLWQETVVPPDASWARLKWWDRVRNHRSYYMDPAQEFRVQIRNTNNEMLAELFSTDVGDPLLDNWQSRDVDISEFVGRRIRVAFVVQTTRYPLNVHLDNVRLDTDVADDTIYDVYFGTAASPGPGEYQGPAANTSWALPTLDSLAPYYWRIVTRTGAESTPGPVWEFTTLGVDHFEWDPIPSPQNTGSAFTVSLAVKDAGGQTLSNFTASVMLSAFGQRSEMPPIVVSEIDTGTPDAAEFTNVSANPVDISGWRVFIYDSWPGRWPAPVVSFTVPSSATCAPGEVFSLIENGTPPGNYPTFNAGANIWWSSGSANLAVLLLDSESNVVDFVCMNSTDPSEISDPILIPADEWEGPPVPGAAALQRAGQSDSNRASDWIGSTTSGLGTLNAGLSLPFTVGMAGLAMTPTNTGLFSAGIWTGDVSIPVTATDAFLRADDGEGHTGDSDPFDVITPPDGTLFLFR